MITLFIVLLFLSLLLETFVTNLFIGINPFFLLAIIILFSRFVEEKKYFFIILFFALINDLLYTNFSFIFLINFLIVGFLSKKYLKENNNILINLLFYYILVILCTFNLFAFSFITRHNNFLLEQDFLVSTILNSFYFLIIFLISNIFLCNSKKKYSYF